jgi:hypothetical protein
MLTLLLRSLYLINADQYKFKHIPNCRIADLYSNRVFKYCVYESIQSVKKTLFLIRYFLVKKTNMSLKELLSNINVALASLDYPKNNHNMKIYVHQITKN